MTTNIYYNIWIMKSFESIEEAREYVRKHVDKPTPDFTKHLGNEVTLTGESWHFDDNHFTNVYDLSFSAGQTGIVPAIVLFDKLTPIVDFVRANPDVHGAMNGGFFYLEDSGDDHAPKQYSLNLALANGHLRSFPVVDREALIVEKDPRSSERRLSVEYVQALGSASINAVELSWSGSRTNHDTDIKIFGNGNSIIERTELEDGRKLRFLNKQSRYTPALDPKGGLVDVGFALREDGAFEGKTLANQGGIDIFTHDVVARMDEKLAHGERLVMRALSLGDRALDGCIQGAISVGPLLHTENLSTHPLNNDPSLGDVSPLTEEPLARALFYEATDGRYHLVIFDGRPGSETFTGVTPRQAIDYIMARGDYVSGASVDGGQTAKEVVREESGTLVSVGNEHYLQYPEHPGGKFTWARLTGRPVPNVIAIRKI